MWPLAQTGADKAATVPARGLRMDGRRLRKRILDDPTLLDATAVAQAAGVDPAQGLTPAEAARRLADQGPNELRPAPRVPRWRRWLAQFQDPLVILLLVAVGIALVAWWIEGGTGWPVDAVVIAVVVVLNATLGRLQEAKAEGAVAALARMTEATATVRRGGQPQRVPSAALVRGDVLLLVEGDAVAADARLLETVSLRVQEAALTGESEAVLKDAATLPQAGALAERSNMVFKGTAVAQGRASAIVTATGMDTEMGGIARLLDATAAQPTPLQQEVARTGRLLGAVVVGIAVVVVATILVLSHVHSAADAIPVLLLGVSLAVAAVPEGLPAILSVVLALGVQRLARRQAVVKGLSSVETLGCASVIASDKTGTLTRGEMTIKRVLSASGRVSYIGAGYAPEGRAEHDGAPLPAGPLRDEQAAVLGGGSLASNAQWRQVSADRWETLGDPTEAAFLVAGHKLQLVDERERRWRREAEIAFTSERQAMAVIVADTDTDTDPGEGDGRGARRLIAKGAPGAVLPRCTQVLVGTQVKALDDALRARLRAGTDAMADAALRTLAVAYRPLEATEQLDTSAVAARAAGSVVADGLEHDLILAGIVGMLDPPRPEAAAAIAEARRAGIRVVMITGDHPRTAARIATDLGIVSGDAPVLTGAQLEALDTPHFAEAVRRTSVYARVAPAHKLRIVQALQADGHVVAMTGDGVNDAPALKAADIGIAMGIAGTEVSKEAAKMILADDNFATIVHAVHEGRAVFDNIRKFLRYLLSSNMGEVLAVFLGVVGAGVIGLSGGAEPAHAVVLPLLATQLLWINLVTDLGPALALGVDPPADDLMARKPRPAAERLIDNRMWRDIFEIGLVVAVLTLLTMDLHLPGGLIAGDQDLATARTAGFNVLVLASLFNCLSARSDNASAFVNLFANRWLWGAIALSVLLQVAVVHLPWLNVAFGTVPLTPQQWAVCVGMASGVLAFTELRKALSRRLKG
jgi:magnesium-transporting ATPase (P-type)